MVATAQRKPFIWFGLAASLAIFLLLLALRLDWFRQPLPMTEPVAGGGTTVATEDAWMGIYQGEQKIGFSHRRFAPIKDGFTIADDTFMRLNTMGMVHDVRLQTDARLGPDRSLAAFTFRLRSSLFSFEAQGEVTGDTLHVTVDGRRSTISLDGPIHLASGILNGLSPDTLAPERPQTFHVFDPTTMTKRPVTVTLTGNEIIDVQGRAVETRKLTVAFAGATGIAWIDAGGRVMQEQGIMGIRLVRSDRETATTGLEATPADLTDVVAVSVDQPLDDAASLSLLRLRVSGIDALAGLDGGRQRFVDGVLTVSRETLPPPAAVDMNAAAEYLAASPLIQSDHARIREAVMGAIDPQDPPLVRVRKLTAWVFRNLEKRPVVSVPNALEVLDRRMGDCNEHAVLLAAMARAAGIPTRVEAGLVYLRGRFYYHAWNVVYLGRWVTVDALMNQIPADVTHLRLVGGDSAGQIDLMGMIGRIRLEVVERR